MKNTLEGINSRLDDTGEWISELEDRVVRVTQAEHTKEKRIFENDDSLRVLWNNITHKKIHITEVPEGKKRERERGAGEIITEKLPNLGNKTDIQV